MSATEQLMEKVKTLDEAQAKSVLSYLNELPSKPTVPTKRRSARDAIGWCLKYNHSLKTTDEWMKFLREGEKD